MIRFLDICFSLLGLLLLSPLFALLAVWIVLDSKGTVFYKQVRVGKDGKDFQLLKFRSMSMNADKGSLLTIGNADGRITRAGHILRKTKLDELPQLLNVLRGDMSFVGPRPEVRRYVELYNDEQKRVLSVRPGITDYASIEYIDESELLGQSADPEQTYIQEIMPKKIAYNMRYIENQSVCEYCKIIFLTIKRIFVRHSKS